MNKRYPSTILATACIPWDDSYEFMEDLFRKQIQNLIKRGIKHIYLFGTAGEGYAVTDRQYEQIVKAFADEMSGPELHPMVGLIHISLPAMMERVTTAYKLGIRDFQFSLPSWGTLTDEELYAFMHELCDPYADCRFLHYNLKRSNRLLQIHDYMKLAEAFPNFVGAKFTTLDLKTIHELIAAEIPIQFFLGELGFGYAHMVGGSCGLLISLGNSHIQKAQAFYEAAVQHDLYKLADYQNQFAGLLHAILQVVGPTYMDGAYDKLFYKLIDPEFPLRLLPPYQSSNLEHFEAYRDYLQNNYPEWLEG